MDPLLLRRAAPDLSRRGVRQLPMEEGQERVKASYKHNYDRLAQIKRRYDPDNVFHVNQNIKPANGSV